MADEQPDEIPSSVPVMVLPGALLFPHALLPLYIFEQRYREMLSYCLQSDRMFCVALIRPGVEEATQTKHFLPGGWLRIDPRLRGQGRRLF